MGENPVIWLIEDLKSAICESGNEYTEVVIRHESEHEFGPGDDLNDFYVYYDEIAEKIIIKVKN